MVDLDRGVMELVDQDYGIGIMDLSKIENYGSGITFENSLIDLYIGHVSEEGIEGMTL